MVCGKTFQPASFYYDNSVTVFSQESWAVKSSEYSNIFELGPLIPSPRLPDLKNGNSFQLNSDRFKFEWPVRIPFIDKCDLKNIIFVNN